MPNDELSLFGDPPPDPAPAEDAPEPTRRKGEYLLPRGRKVEHCRSCGKPIVWIRTPAGKALPLSVSTARTATSGERYALPHFFDCPQSKEWSKHGASATKPDDPVLREGD